jgi:hypothetical protein
LKAGQATAEVFFTAFKALKSEEKDVFLEKVINDPELREDLIDIALIEKAKKVKGKSVSAKEYFSKRRKAGKAAWEKTMRVE